MIRRPRTAAATRQRHGSQGRNTTRGIAPAAFRLRSASARSTALTTQPRCDIAVFDQRLVARTDSRRSEPVGLAATLSAVTAKKLKRPRSGSDRRRRGFVSGGHSVSLPNRCFTGVRHSPSRRRTVRPAAEGAFFHGAKRSAKPTVRSGVALASAAGLLPVDGHDREPNVAAIAAGSAAYATLADLTALRSAADTPGTSPRLPPADAGGLRVAIPQPRTTRTSPGIDGGFTLGRKGGRLSRLSRGQHPGRARGGGQGSGQQDRLRPRRHLPAAGPRAGADLVQRAARRHHARGGRRRHPDRRQSRDRRHRRARAIPPSSTTSSISATASRARRCCAASRSPAPTTSRPAPASKSPIESDDIRKTPFFYTDGGGIKIYARSYPTIEHVEVFGNYTSPCGGGVSVEHLGQMQESALFRNCIFRNNRTQTTGSARRSAARQPRDDRELPVRRQHRQHGRGRRRPADRRRISSANTAPAR